jgi:hypothetical protein
MPVIALLALFSFFASEALVVKTLELDQLRGVWPFIQRI